MAQGAVDVGPAIGWLLCSPEPGVRALVRRELLGEPTLEDLAAIVRGPWVSALLSGQTADGGFGQHPYRKWTGAHWRLASLVELGIPATHPPMGAVAERVLRWLTSDPYVGSIARVDGLWRAHASINGNALQALCRLGLADDPRVEGMARALVQWQWPDGGWNCDYKATGYRSSFHESLLPAWGLAEYARATGTVWAGAAAERTADLLLDHRIFRSLKTGGVINRRWLALRYPAYWHYGVLPALTALARMGHLPDPRAEEAIAHVLDKRGAEGVWHADGSWWNPPGHSRAPEVVNWGREGGNVMITLEVLRVLKAAGYQLR